MKRRIKIGFIISLVFLVWVVSAINIDEDVENNEIRLFNRTENIDFYFNKTSKDYTAIIYPKNVNMRNLSGDYEPYEEVTEFSFDNNNLLINWNDKSVRLEIYIVDMLNNKKRLNEMSFLERQRLEFKTNIMKGRGTYYYNHTLSNIVSPLISRIGYEILTTNVVCGRGRENNFLVCDEQRIDFSDAVNSQNLSVNISSESVEFSGRDLSYIDPTVQLNADDNGFAERDYGNGFYSWTADVLRAGSNCYDGCTKNEEYRSHVEFEVGTLPYESNITDVNACFYYSSVNDADCVNDFDMRIHKFDAEKYDITPDTEQEESDLFLGLNSGISLGNIYDKGSSTTGYQCTSLNSPTYNEIKDNIDGIPEDSLDVGLVRPQSGSSPEDCRVRLGDSTIGNVPYIQVTYTLPDTTAPVTSASATSPPGGFSYTFGTVTNDSVRVTLSCSDGSSGCKNNYPKYCTDITNICSPLTIYSSPFDISTGGISYIRYQSKDNANNTETINSQTIKIDRNYTYNVTIIVNNTIVWKQDNYFVNTQTVDNLTTQLNSALASCTADSEGYCTIPIKIHSDNAGRINISDINIYFNITEYFWNISNFPKLSTYRVRVRATDGILNSSWDESNGDFRIGLNTTIDFTKGNVTEDGYIHKYLGFPPTYSRSSGSSTISIGASDSANTYRSYIQFNTSFIQDTAIIEKTTLNLSLSTIGSVSGCDIKSIENLNLGSTSNENLYNDIGDGTTYVSSGGFCGQYNSSTDLGTIADSHLQGNLSNNVFGVGIKWTSEGLPGTLTQIYSSEGAFDPVLIVTYTV
ncbi:MAG: hypothetical protein AABX83_01180 [Nanoarchaeota archaeon]